MTVSSLNFTTLCILLQGLGDAEDLEGLRNLVAEMKAMPTCVLDRVAYTAIIDACIACGSPEREFKLNPSICCTILRSIRASVSCFCLLSKSILFAPRTVLI